MIALDTSVLVRLLVRDDEAQARLAVRLVAELDKSGERAHVSGVVVCELVWVLGRAYRFSRGSIADVLEKLFVARQLYFQDQDRMLRALAGFRQGRGDFSDYLIREQALGAGCEGVVTFDRVLQREPGFRAL